MPKEGREYSIEMLEIERQMATRNIIAMFNRSESKEIQVELCRSGANIGFRFVSDYFTRDLPMNVPASAERLNRIPILLFASVHPFFHRIHLSAGCRRTQQHQVTTSDLALSNDDECDNQDYEDELENGRGRRHSSPGGSRGNPRDYGHHHLHPDNLPDYTRSEADHTGEESMEESGRKIKPVNIVAWPRSYRAARVIATKSYVRQSSQAWLPCPDGVILRDRGDLLTGPSGNKLDLWTLITPGRSMFIAARISARRDPTDQPEGGVPALN
ncbi:hypothetical protein WN48_08418 [Eufriesea mexicana]|uniref:Uncharacterized protein n=1 Tax=Eufriesea mexicana TaxID=516756 RepID=A0A310SF32_9HYME|nr:hypothetical protein WN48_08418 [Eufriesea mexicana]